MIYQIYPLSAETLRLQAAMYLAGVTFWRMNDILKYRDAVGLPSVEQKSP